MTYWLERCLDMVVGYPKCIHCLDLADWGIGRWVAIHNTLGLECMLAVVLGANCLMVVNRAVDPYFRHFVAHNEPHVTLLVQIQWHHRTWKSTWISLHRWNFHRAGHELFHEYNLLQTSVAPLQLRSSKWMGNWTISSCLRSALHWISFGALSSRRCHVWFPWKLDHLGQRIRWSHSRWTVRFWNPQKKTNTLKIAMDIEVGHDRYARYGKHRHRTGITIAMNHLSSHKNNPISYLFIKKVNVAKTHGKSITFHVSWNFHNKIVQLSMNHQIIIFKISIWIWACHSYLLLCEI